ncbi:MAG: hypothetical protein AAB357_01045, partial [Actinomycetota bacterium]
GLANDFFEKLVSVSTFSFQIDFEGIDMTSLSEREKNRLYLLARRLNNTVYDDEDQFLEYGVRNFALGYPLIIRREQADPTKVTKAPLILWSLKIEKSPRKMNCWTISREEGSPVVLNELLRNHIASDTQISLERLPDEITEDGIVSAEEIATVCGDILKQLNTRQPDAKALKPKVVACPTKEKVEALAIDDACIQWSGIFGLYRAQKEPIIKRTEEIADNLARFQDLKLELEDFQKTTTSAVNTDPSKEQIICSLTKSEVKVIQGPPGTGKSQALTAIITNTLENGGKCLVVCEKRTALEVVYKNLKDIGLEDYVVLVEDVNHDRNTVVKKARSRAENMRHQAMYQNREFDQLNDRYERLKAELGKRNAALVEKVLGDFNWNDLVGLFMRHSRRTTLPLLNEGYEKCAYTNDEYTSLVERLTEAAILFNAADINALKALTKLKSDLFKVPYSRVSFDSLSSYARTRTEALKDAVASSEQIDTLPLELIAAIGEEKTLETRISSLDLGKAELEKASRALVELEATGTNPSSVHIDLLNKVQSLVLSKAKAVRSHKETYLKHAGQYEIVCAA